MVATLVVIYFLNAKVIRTNVYLIDMALVFPIISIVITTITAAGLVNSINIIDGFSGLASMVAMMMFASLAHAAFHVGDTLILIIAFVMIEVILGFFIWNFPAGYTFLGDGGACIIGFALAECNILLMLHNVSVSAWYPVLMVIYPIFEMLSLTCWRRVLKGAPAGHPDGVHLHILIYQRVIRWVVGSKDERHQLRRNPLISPYFWLLSLLAVLPTTLFWDNELVLLGFVTVFIFFYVRLHWCIVRPQSSR